ncbi:hypothetical protein PMAYCL1PPCAC_13324, partial [Pristionchus mayeri]
IVVVVSSASYIIKALHQIGFALAAFYDLQGLYEILWATYPVVNGISTYAPPICLVFFSAKVRSRIVFKAKFS